MNPLTSPKNKILAASALLLALGAAASTSGLDAALLARVLVGILAVAGLAWWWYRARAVRPEGDAKPRLAIVSRSGLSQRTGLALVEVDGRALLIVHGDGFAEICEPGGPRRRRTARRPAFKTALRSVS